MTNTQNQIAASLGTAIRVSLSALPTVIEPDKDAATQLYLGCHYAFSGASLALVALFVLTVVFVRVMDTEQLSKRGASVEETHRALSWDELGIGKCW